ncbi:MAG: tetratricopeptide repeat protein, partial [Candidatus Riflebacteria bacterium]
IFAIFLFLTSGQASSASPSGSVSRGLEFLAAGKLEEAEKEFQQARFAEPDNAAIQYNLGHVRFRRHQYENAARYFADAAEKAENADLRFNSLHNLGNASFRMGDYAMAIDAYQKGLEIRKDKRTEFNLKAAEEKLRQQQEKQQQNQQQNQKDQQNQQSQNKDQSGNEQQKKDGDQQQKGQQSPNGNEGDSKMQPDEQKQDGQKQGSDKNSSDEAKSEKNQENSQAQDQKANEKKQPDGQSSSQEKNESDQQKQEAVEDSQEQNRQDVEMAQEKDKDSSGQESQRARALKNRKLNPYMIEKMMREMQEREKQAQLYYRNDPQRIEEMDPFNMNAQQLQEWMKNRGRPKPKETDEPDW